VIIIQNPADKTSICVLECTRKTPNVFVLNTDAIPKGAFLDLPRSD